MKSNFPAAQESYHSLLQASDHWVKNFFLPKIPPAIETYHLTLATLPLAGINILAGFLAHLSLRYLLILSLTIFLQHITDLLDGAIGRSRKTGLLRWGYYMDKFVDFIFVSSICLSIALAFPQYFLLSILPIVTYGGLMLQSILYYAATQISEKQYMQLGPTEMKFIVFCAILAVSFLGNTVVPIVLVPLNIALGVILAMTVFQSQQRLWQLDMKLKRQRKRA